MQTYRALTLLDLADGSQLAPGGLLELNAERAAILLRVGAVEAVSLTVIDPEHIDLGHTDPAPPDAPTEPVPARRRKHS